MTYASISSSSSSSSCSSAFSSASSLTSLSSAPGHSFLGSQKTNAMGDTKTKMSGAPVPKKIPRPPNSFLIYRKEHAKKYAGLVATELSTKLAMAWKKETPERQAYYAELAKLAKQEHTIKFPGYKFTPVKRGTGKRALQLAAAANATRAASGEAGDSSMQNKNPTSKKKANVPRSSACMPEMSDPILASTRSGRQISKPQRYTPSVSYSKKNTYSRSSAIPRAYPSSLFFSPSPYENYSLEASIVPISSSSPSPSFPAQANHHYSLESGSDLSDPDDGDDDDYPGLVCHTDRLLLRMGQQAGITSPTRPWMFDNTPPLANQVFEPLAMDTFEPECLAHHYDPSSSSSSSLWSTPEGSPTAVMMRQLYEQYHQQHVFPTHHYPCHHQHHQNPVHQLVPSIYSDPVPLYPSFNNTRDAPLQEALPLPSQQQGCPISSTIQFSIEIDKLQQDLTSLLQSPVSTPSMMAMPPSDTSPSSCVSEGLYSLVPSVIQEDIMMSPALSTCSSASSLSGAQDVQSYFARALELL